MDAPTRPSVSQGDREAGLVASSVYAGGRRVQDIAIEEAGEWSKRSGHVVWIGLLDADLLQRLQAQLGLHYLAIEDAGTADQDPKVEQYGNAVFVVGQLRTRAGGLPFTRESLKETGRRSVLSMRPSAAPGLRR